MSPIAVIATIISTLDDIKEGPESSFYLPFMGKISLDTFQVILAVIVKHGLCKVENHYVTFTQPAPGSKGEEILNEVRRILATV